MYNNGKDERKWFQGKEKKEQKMQTENKKNTVTKRWTLWRWIQNEWVVLKTKPKLNIPNVFVDGDGSIIFGCSPKLYSPLQLPKNKSNHEIDWGKYRAD